MLIIILIIKIYIRHLGLYTTQVSEGGGGTALEHKII